MPDIIRGNLESFHGSIGSPDYLRIVISPGKERKRPEWLLAILSGTFTIDGRGVDRPEDLIGWLLTRRYVRVSFTYGGAYNQVTTDPLEKVTAAAFETTERPEYD